MIEILTKVWSIVQHRPGASQKCRLFGPVPGLLNQNRLCNETPLPTLSSDLCAQWRLRNFGVTVMLEVAWPHLQEQEHRLGQEKWTSSQGIGEWAYAKELFVYDLNRGLCISQWGLFHQLSGLWCSVTSAGNFWDGGGCFLTGYWAGQDICSVEHLAWYVMRAQPMWISFLRICKIRTEVELSG